MTRPRHSHPHPTLGLPLARDRSLTTLTRPSPKAAIRQGDFAPAGLVARMATVGLTARSTRATLATAVVQRLHQCRPTLTFVNIGLTSMAGCNSHVARQMLIVEMTVVSAGHAQMARRTWIV